SLRTNNAVPVEGRSLGVKVTHFVRKSISRRALLGGVAGVAGVAGLAACRSDGDGGGPIGAGPSDSLKTPAFVPFTGTNPHKRVMAGGVSRVFYNFPGARVSREGYTRPEGESFTALM